MLTLLPIKDYALTQGGALEAESISVMGDYSITSARRPNLVCGEFNVQVQL